MFVRNKENRDMRGIYKITQITTGKVYIGQSMNIDNRWNQHAACIDNYRRSIRSDDWKIREENNHDHSPSKYLFHGFLGFQKGNH